MSIDASGFESAVVRHCARSRGKGGEGYVTFSDDGVAIGIYIYMVHGTRVETGEDTEGVGEQGGVVACRSGYEVDCVVLQIP